MKKAVLFVSFGTTHEDARENSLDQICNALAAEAEDMRVYQAYTSKMIIGKLSDEGIFVDSVEEAIRVALGDGVRLLYVIPSHIIPGVEYQKLVRVVENYRSRFAEVRLATPVLDKQEDCRRVALLIKDILKDTGVDYQQCILMGHGTEDAANIRYAEMNEAFAGEGYDNIRIASVEAKPDLEDALSVMKGKDIGNVLVHPFMVVAGDHAKNDMAGKDKDSYVSRLQEAGYQVSAVVKGLGEYESFRNLYVEKLKELMA